MRSREAVATLAVTILFLLLVCCLAGQAAYAEPRPLPERSAPRIPEEARVTARVQHVYLNPYTCLSDQAGVDAGGVCLWMTDPVPLLAGHQHLGWDFLDSIPTGSIVHVSGSAAAGVYRVTGHREQYNTHAIPSWMYDSSLDLVLQTCRGPEALGFSLLERV